jgi:hypothetical protein
MQRLVKNGLAGLLLAAGWVISAGPACAQIYTRPTGPEPRPVGPTYATSCPGCPPVAGYVPPPSSYSFYGPSAGTVGYAATTSYYVLPSPRGDRVVQGATLVPIWGYTPGYYGGYDVVRYFRP